MMPALTAALNPARSSLTRLSWLAATLLLLAGCATTVPPSEPPRASAEPAIQPRPAPAPVVRGPAQRLPADVPLSEIASAPRNVRL